MADAAPDYNSIYNSALSQSQAQNAPVIQSLQAQQPALEDQYKSLIGQLQGQQQQAIGNTQTQTSRDFGARGISPTSGLFSQTLGERVQPITTDYTNRITSAGAQHTNDLQQLATQIAQAQSGVTDQARQLAQQQYGNAYQQYSDAQSRAYQQQQLAASRASAATPTLLGAQAANPQTQQAQAAPQNLVNDIKAWSAGNTAYKGATFLDFVAKYASVMPLQDIVTLYNQNSGQGGIKESPADIQKTYAANKTVAFGHSVRF